MSTNKKYVGEEAARVLAAGIGAATPRTWDLTPDDLDSVTEEEQDGMVLMQFPTPARLKASLADIKTGDRLDASSAFGISACHLTVTTVLRDDASDGTFYHVFASMDSADDGIVYNFCIGNDNVAIVLLPLVEPDPSKLSASAGGSSWQYGAIPNWGDLGQSSAWFYYGTGSSSQPRDFKIGDIFRTPTLVPYGSPPSVASSDPADQASANYAEGTIIGTGKVQNVPYLVVVGAARFGKMTSATPKNAETITAPGIFYVTRPSTNYWYVKFYPLLNKWKELEKIAGEILVISAGLGIANEKTNVTRDKLGGLTNAVPPRVIVGRLPRIGSKGTHNYYLTPQLQYSDGSQIHVSLNTQSFRRWCGDADVTEPFIIEAVGLQRVYLSVAPGYPNKDIATSISPVNISVENGVATITKKTLGQISLWPYGLHADMAVYKDPFGFGPQTSDGRLIVRYDEVRGWVGCNFPHRAGGFAIDRLAPPTYAEVVAVLLHRHPPRANKYIQIQFRSRAVKPKGVSATEATKKYNFWSYKKKRGAVFRVRRTHGGRYSRTTDNPDTGRRVKTPSYAHRNFGASEWHYYSVKWRSVVGSDGKKERRIAALRRLG